MDPDARAAYDAQLEAALADEADGYTGEPLSKWMPTAKPSMAKHTDPNENRAVFVVRAQRVKAVCLIWVWRLQHHAIGALPVGGRAEQWHALPSLLCLRMKTRASAASSACGTRRPRSALRTITAAAAPLHSGSIPRMSSRARSVRVLAADPAQAHWALGLPGAPRSGAFCVGACVSGLATAGVERGVIADLQVFVPPSCP